MSALRNDVDPDGLLEFSVVFSDRSLNSMSAAFGDVMRDISRILKKPIMQRHWQLFPAVEHMVWKRSHANLPQIGQH